MAIDLDTIITTVIVSFFSGTSIAISNYFVQRHLIENMQKIALRVRKQKK